MLKICKNLKNTSHTLQASVGSFNAHGNSKKKTEACLKALSENL